jgi:hypothetical protein
MERLGFCEKEMSANFSVSSRFCSFSKHIFEVRKNYRLRLIFHCAGISMLGAALFLQSSVCSGILEKDISLAQKKTQLFCILKWL